MAFNVRMLDSNSTINNLIPISEVSIPPGGPYTIMFQLLSQTSNTTCPQRFIPPVPSSTVMIQIAGNSANTQTIMKTATLAFVGDSSVYRVDLTADETANIGSVNLQVLLNDGANTTTGWAYNSIIPGTASPYWC